MNKTLSILLTILIVSSFKVAFSTRINEKTILINPIIIGSSKTFEESFDCHYTKEAGSKINYLFFEPTYIEHWTNDSFKQKIREVNSIINLILVDSNQINTFNSTRFYEDYTIIVLDKNTACKDLPKLISLKIKQTDNKRIAHDRIEFLNKQEGEIAIIDDSFESYFSRLQRKEIFALTKKWSPKGTHEQQIKYVKSLFQESVMEFSLHEKQVINRIIVEIEKHTHLLNLTLYHKTPWRFIKVDKSIAGGFAHTRGTYIIISEQYLNSSNETDNERQLKEDVQLKLVRLLFHEKTHILQRLYPGVFNLLYEKYWGYKKVQLDLSGLDFENQILNPDSDTNPWVYSYKKDYYWINVSLKDSVKEPKMGIDFETKAYKMVEENGVFKFAKNSAGLLIWSDISELKTLIKAFPNNRGIDSPNEISAYLMEGFISNKIEEHDFLEQDINNISKGEIDIKLWIDDYLSTY